MLIKDYIFVLMPFSNEFDEIYFNTIKPVIEKMDYECLRADENIGPIRIMDDIWSSIKQSKILIADLTGRNPNVFYELGLAHSTEKPVILITQSINDVPFDLKHIRVIKYKTDKQGNTNLSKELEKTIEKIHSSLTYIAKSKYAVLDSPTIIQNDNQLKQNAFNVGVSFGKFHHSFHILKIMFNKRVLSESVNERCYEIEKLLSNLSIHFPIPRWIHELEQNDYDYIFRLCKREIQKQLKNKNIELYSLFQLGYEIVEPMVDLFWIGEKSDKKHFAHTIVILASESDLPQKYINKISRRFDKYFENEFPEKRDVISKYFVKMEKDILKIFEN